MTRIIWKLIKDKLIHPYLDMHARLLRPVDREPRRDRRPGDDRRGQRHQEARRRRQVRDHHARRGARQGIQPQGDVEAPNGTIRNILGGVIFREPIICQQRAAPGARLDPADRHRPPRLRRPVPRHRLPLPRQGQADDQVRRRGRQGDRARGVRLARRRRRHGDVQSRRIRSASSPAPRFNYGLQPQLSGLPVDQEHHPQGLRRPLQGHLPGGVRRRVQGRVRRQQASPTSTA